MGMGRSLSAAARAMPRTGTAEVEAVKGWAATWGSPYEGSVRGMGGGAVVGHGRDESRPYEIAWTTKHAPAAENRGGGVNSPRSPAGECNEPG
jgi:hypothetical protein